MGVLAPKLHQLLTKLHRASIVMIGTTYVQLTTRTGPELLTGMRKLGYVDGVDFWDRRFPDKKYGIELPYNCPMDAQYAMFFRNPGTNKASVLRLVSQDVPGSANGLSVSAVMGDEAKMFNKKKLDTEVMAINRGGHEYYGDMAEHHSVTFTTDMPVTRDEKWVMGDRDESLKPHHQKAVELILSLQRELYLEKQQLKISSRNGARLKRIAQYEDLVAKLRRGLVHVPMASSFANVHALGMAYFRDRKRSFTPSAFNAAILNIESDGVENGFYPGFEQHKHCYDATDYSFVNEKTFTSIPMLDCRKDLDLDLDRPLVIGMDYGASFNCMVVGQRFSRLHLKNTSGRDEVRYQKAFHVAEPGLVQDVVAQFVEYYRYFYKKEVVYVYDQTATGRNGLSPMTYADEVIKALKAAGWRVKVVYLGQIPPHNSRYLGWNWTMREGDERFALQRFNRENMRLVTEAMKNAQVKEGKNGYEKNKNAEGLTEVDQSTTTHYTDALDTVFWYCNFVEPNRTDLLPVVLGG
jgi:hypothetical protein